jgi:DNA-binding PadR family transcriptional regulator
VMGQRLVPDNILLGLLAKRSRHGYELLACFRDPAQLGLIWSLSTSQLYAVLKRLEQQGFTESRKIEVPDAPARTEYRITDAGINQLEIWLNEPCPSPSVRYVRVEFLSRLYIARLLHLPTQQLVERQKQVCQQEYHRLSECQQQTEPGISWLAMDLQIAQLQTILQWLARCELTPRE